MTLTNEEIQEIKRRCKAADACAEEYRRLTQATTSEDVWEVLLDNTAWVINHGILTAEQLTPEVCLAAVKQEGWVVQHLTEKQRTPEVCIAAVKQNSLVVRWLTKEQRSYLP